MKSIFIPPVPAPDRGIPCNVLGLQSDKLAYPTGSSVVIALLNSDSAMINHHSYAVSSVAFSPSRSWIASGDIRGNLKIWSSSGERLVKYEYKLFAGSVRAIAWSSDSKRVAVCGGEVSKGEAVCISYDTGARLGEVGGHAKTVISVAYRPKAPYRIITGGEDSKVIFQEGPPFKFMRSHQTVHSGLVTGVAFSSDGDTCYSCSSEGTIAMYDGEKGDLLKTMSRLGCSIWGLCCLGASAVVVACGDKTVKFFDGSFNLEKTITVGDGQTADTPMGIASDGENTFAVLSLSGEIIRFEKEKEISRICGSNGAIVGISMDAISEKIIVGSSSVREFSNNLWCIEGGRAVAVNHKSFPIKPSLGMYFDSVGNLNGVTSSGSAIVNVTTGAVWETGLAIAQLHRHGIIVTKSGLVHAIIEFGKSTKLVHDFGGPLDGMFCVAQSGDIAYVARSQLSVIEKNNDELSSNPEVYAAVSGQSSALAIWDKNLIAIADSSNHTVNVFKNKELVPATTRCWTYHKARITVMAWVDQQYLVTGSLDKHVFVWDLHNPTNGPVASLKNIHRDGVSALWAALTVIEGKTVRIVTGGYEGAVVINYVDL